MAKIATVGRDKWKAVFNNRSIIIHEDGKDIKAADTGTGEIIEGPELSSIKNFLIWHRKSRRDTSELPVVRTVN